MSAVEKKINKIVLAYSGGLDTSVILKWLQVTYNCEVVTFTADIGQGEELAPHDAQLGMRHRAPHAAGLAHGVELGVREFLLQVRLDLVEVLEVQIEQGRAFESLRVDVIEDFGKVVWVAPQLRCQVVGELNGSFGMPILHHHHHPCHWVSVEEAGSNLDCGVGLGFTS